MGEDTDQISVGRNLVYFAAERTLMSWIRGALSLMALGFVIDRFGLVLRQVLPKVGPELFSQAFSFWAGTLLVVLGTVMAAVGAVRYLIIARAFRKGDNIRTAHGLMLGVVFTFLVAIFGGVISVFLMLATD